MLHHAEADGRARSLDNTNRIGVEDPVMNNRRQPELSGRARERIELGRIGERYRTIRTGLRVLGGVGATYCPYLTVDSIAGKTTVFSAALSVLADIRVAVALTLAGCAAA